MVHSSPNITLEEGAAPLLRWYDACRRPFPWRETNDPYAVWISEVMLQQTQAARGVEYHRRWMRTFPTLRSLAEAEDDDVLKAWEGLGYYSRARNLLRAARLLQARRGSGDRERALRLRQALVSRSPRNTPFRWRVRS